MITLEEFANQTALLPAVIADTARSHRNLQPDEFFSKSCEQRFLAMDERKTYHKQFRGAKSLQYAYMYVNHWLDAYLQNSELYKQRHPLEETK